MTRFAGTHDAPSQILRQAASVAIANALAGVTACALAAFAPVLAVAAAVDEAPGASLRFNNLTTEDGLAQNWVSSIEQDQTGFIWIGTHGGLQRFDGRDMQTFLHDPQDDRTVSDNSISALHEDNSGNLWVGTSTAGVNRFVAAERRFERYRHQAGDEASLVHNRIWALESDSTGRVWIATDGGLDSLDPATGEITHHRVNGAPDGSSVVRSLLTDREGLVWVGTFDGLYVVSPESLTLSRFAPRGQAHSEGQNEGQNEGDGMLGNAGVNALFEDRVGRLWIGTSEGVFVASQDRSTVTAVIGAEELRRDRSGTPVATAMVEDDRGGLWVATDGAGLYRLRAGREGQWQRNHYVHNPGNPLGLTDNYLGTAFRDSGGVLWFGTSIAGISRLNPATEAFAHYRRSSSDEGQLPGNVVWSMLEAANGDVWVATENGLALLDVATGRFAPVTVGESDAANRSELVYYVTRSANGTLWVGSEAGLFSRDETGQAFEFHDVFADYADIDYAPIVHYIREDSAGVLWLGTFNGLIRYEPASRSATLIRRADGELVDDWVMAAVEGRDGTIWAGTEAGLQKIDRATGRSLAVYKNVPGDLNSLSHDSVQSLYVSNNGGLWVATVAGLSHLDVQSGSFVRYGRDTGLPSDYIYAVTGDDSGLLWVSTNKGLARLDPATGSVVAFDVEDGLQASEFNTGSVHRGDSGRLYFGGVNGFNAFLPDRVIARPQPPRVAVTSASFVGAGDVHGGASGTLEYLEVPADLGVFELRFAAFDYAAPRRNRFAYRLEGVDQDWQDAGPASSVTYRNLPPGSYTFQVRAARGDGVWSTEPAQVTLTVLAPWWRSRAAIIVYLLALLCVAVVGVRLWAARLERERLLREEREKRSVAERMHSITRGLSATLNTGSVSEQLLSSAVDLVPHTLSALFLREDGDLKLVDTRGVAEPQKSSLRSMPTSAGTVLLDIVQAAEPVALPAAALFGDSGEGNALGMEHALCAPLVQGGSFVGVLILARRSGRAFSREEQRIAGLLVNQALHAFQNARLYSEIERQAITDDLTGLYNRGHFLDLARREFSRSVRYDSELSLILLDADHFKSINDLHGHQAGDEVLRALAEICDSATRSFDIVGRYGGEEFVIVLPETPIDVATTVARRIRSGVDQALKVGEQLEVRLTISAGVASRTARTPDLLSLINTADQALYAAKRDGRNQVKIAQADDSKGSVSQLDRA